MRVPDASRTAVELGTLFVGRQPILDRALQTIGYAGHMTAEFVASLDRSVISEREIGDASEAGGGPGMEKFLRDHSTGAVPELYYDRYAQQSIDHLRAALTASASTV